MTQKTFYINLEKQEFNHLKVINEKIKFKGLIREVIGDNQNIKVLDNNSTISNVYIKKKKNIGAPLNWNMFSFKHKFNEDLTLKLPLGYTTNTDGLVKDYQKKLAIHFKKKSFKRINKKAGVTLKRNEILKIKKPFLLPFKIKRLKLLNEKKKIKKVIKKMRINDFKKQKGFSKFLKIQLFKSKHLSKKRKIKKVIRRNPAILLNKNKGGCLAYSAGLKGFVPKSQIKLAYKAFFNRCKKKFKKFSKKKRVMLTILNAAKILPIRVPLKVSSVSLNASNKIKNFSRLKSLKRFSSSINCVFIYKKLKFKKYAKQKNKKNIKQFKNKSFSKKRKFSVNRNEQKFNENKKNWKWDKNHKNNSNNFQKNRKFNKIHDRTPDIISKIKKVSGITDNK